MDNSVYLFNKEVKQA